MASSVARGVTWNRLFWLGVYLGAVLAPLVVLLLGPTPAKGGFWWDVGVGLGFAGLVMMSIQFMLTARFRAATAPFGIDLIYFFHRYLAYVLLLVVLAHPAILIALDPTLARELNPWNATWAMRAGLASLVLLLVLVVISAARKPLGIEYDTWRIAHWALAVGAVLLGFVHLRAVGYYSGPPVSRALWIAIGLSLLLVVLRVRVWRPLKLLRRPWRVVEVRPEPGSTWTLAVEPVEGERFDFAPGQFAWLTLRQSPLAMQEHPFSIASSPHAVGGRIEFAIKERGDFTSSIGEIDIGETAYVEGPYGAFSIDRYPDAAGYVFIAGGIGIAPMLSMVRTLADRSDKRQHLLVVAGSRLQRIPFREELRELAERMALRTEYVLEKPPREWEGEQGWLDCEKLQRMLPESLEGQEFFVCGPVPMIRLVERCLHELGVPGGRIHTELFDLA